MKFNNTRVMNFEGALRGMRNPKESHHLSDSFFDLIINLDNQSLAPLLLYLIIIGAYYLIFFAHLIYTVVKNKKIIYYDRISKTRVISDFDKNV